MGVPQIDAGLKWTCTNMYKMLKFSLNENCKIFENKYNCDISIMIWHCCHPWHHILGAVFKLKKLENITEMLAIQNLLKISSSTKINI